MFKPNAATWAKADKLGRNRYILRYGVVGWGVPVAFMFSLIQALLDGWNTFVPQLGISLILFPIIGVIVGLITWKQMEKAHGNVRPAVVNGHG